MAHLCSENYHLWGQSKEQSTQHLTILLAADSLSTLLLNEWDSLQGRTLKACASDCGVPALTQASSRLV